MVHSHLYQFVFLENFKNDNFCTHSFSIIQGQLVHSLKSIEDYMHVQDLVYWFCQLRIDFNTFSHLEWNHSQPIRPQTYICLCLDLWQFRSCHIWFYINVLYFIDVYLKILSFIHIPDPLLSIQNKCLQKSFYWHELS